MTTPVIEPDGGLDLALHSPDAESRAVLARVGDVFPLDPSGHLLMASGERPSQMRPWGLRFSRQAQPRAGQHEGPTNETSGHPDGQPGSPEEMYRD
ncbi:hypothetical protein [Jiangella alkaliphila]|uniref:Uncharacterized protein n=1 Tax=Jiangella alkaliphila TaxID=419479 RepID=A0A1H2LL29_9ACTN|nr:hypothetical protein [Jiangella alkaliphila]SDU81096.1 hypothetical protein SAMN04488563_6269 [Jiangella alkaliphila]